MTKIKLIIFALCFFFHSSIANPKIGTDEAGLNLGWPNFFNPKQAILGEVDPEKNKEKIKFEQKNDFPLTDSETDEIAGIDETFYDEENLLDYTIKGGLRGTYYVLNNSPVNSFNNLSQETQDTINQILIADDQTFRNVDEKLQMGETTEEGLKLKTPLFIKTTSKNLGKYGARITYINGNETANIIHFGNWCGRGGRSAPVDNFDNCCLEQEKCYGRIIKQCPDVWNKPYQYMYAWVLLEDEPICVRSEYSCINYVCDCDREATQCVKHFVDHPWEVATGYVPQNQQPFDYIYEEIEADEDYEDVEHDVDYEEDELYEDYEEEDYYDEEDYEINE